MGYWREEFKDDPVFYRAYANLLDASENNIPAFEREVQRQGLWEEYQVWRQMKENEKAEALRAENRVVFSAGKKMISGVVALFKGKEHVE